VEFESLDATWWDVWWWYMAGLDSYESIVGIEKAAQHGKAEDAHHCMSIAA
jgi:hypothetical protein